MDAYGPRVQVGGGAFSGKDPTKVDLSAALMARKIAIESMKEENTYSSTITVSYAIGKKEPIMITETKQLFICNDQLQNVEVYDRTEELKERFYPVTIAVDMDKFTDEQYEAFLNNPVVQRGIKERREKEKRRLKKYNEETEYIQKMGYAPKRKETRGRPRKVLED